MLAHLSPDVPRDEWAAVAMALKAELGDAGFDLFDAWSQRGEKYRADAVRSTWRSIKASGGRTGGTLVRMAKAAGWRPDPAQAEVHKPTPAELKAQAAARRESEERERAATAQRQRAAADEAARLLADASESGASPYLQRKGVKAHGLRFLPDGSALVPMRDAAGELHNLQTIKPERPGDGAPEKLFLKGGRKSGLFHLLGEPEGAAWLLICEGYATAASCHEATGRPVAVAFDAGNLVHVARALRGRWPEARLLICGDDDAATAERTGKNAGRDKAAAAARLVPGTATAFPAFLDSEGEGRSDFNDLQAVAGLDAVHCMIEEAIAQAEADAERAAQGTEGRGAGKGATPAEKAPPAGRQRAARGTGGDGAAGGSGSGSDGTGGPRDLFRVDEDGLWFDGGDSPTRVCDALRVPALARDMADNRAALVLEFDAIYRRGRRWLLPVGWLAGEPRQWLAELYGMGFAPIADPKRRGWLATYLQTRRPAELVRHTPRVGWHGRCYVLPDETLGDSAGERVLFHSDAGAEANFRQRGKLEQWQADLSALCVGNSRLAFAVCVALAGPLLAWSPEVKGGGFHYFGATSAGKTTGLLLAASVWGKGSENDPESFVQKWRATSSGLEYLGEQHNDCTLILDELGQIDASDAGPAAYMLADGMGKNRSKAAGGLRPKPSWRLLFLSSGELTLAQHMETAAQRMKGGQEVRLIPLPAEVAPGSTLEHCHQFDTGHELSEWVKARAVKHYGTAGRAWLLWLTEHTHELQARIAEHMEAFAARYVRDEASGQVKRGARRFALAAAAGEMATAEGLTGWPKGEAMRAAGTMLEAWLATRPGGIGDSEEATILRDLRQWFGMFGQMNFARWGVLDNDHKPNTPMMCGWRRDIVGDTVGAKGERLVEQQVGTTWYVLAEPFRSTVCKGHNHRRVLDVLKKHKLIELEPSGRALHRAKPPGYTRDGADVYRITSRILSGAEED
ncbi:MAG: DUF927 domain-containing protein [Burkholderiales bacterium]|nr:DUF927 domain-containing protein [Burkholderiales bacterium]